MNSMRSPPALMTVVGEKQHTEFYHIRSTRRTPYSLTDHCEYEPLAASLAVLAILAYEPAFALRFADCKWRWALWPYEGSMYLVFHGRNKITCSLYGLPTEHNRSPPRKTDISMNEIETLLHPTCRQVPFAQTERR